MRMQLGFVHTKVIEGLLLSKSLFHVIGMCTVRAQYIHTGLAAQIWVLCNCNWDVCTLSIS